MAGRFSAARVGSGPDKSALKTIITGGAGKGKTYLVSTITGDDGGPVFMIPVEEGLKGACSDASPMGFKDEHERWITPANIGEFVMALDAFVREVNVPVEQMVDGRSVKRRPYRHLGIDSLSGIEKLVLESACGVEKARHMEDKEYKRVWSAAMPLWESVQAKLDEVRRTGVNIWLIAHAVEDYDSSTTTGDVFKKWDLMLRGSGKTLAEIRHFWRSWADNIWYIEKSIKVSKGDKTKRAMASLGGRILVCQETGSIAAKSRLNMPPTIPATWSEIQRAFKAGTPVKVDKAREQVVALLPQLDDEGRATIEAELAAAKNGPQLAAVLSHARGMLDVMGREEEGAGEEPGEGPGQGDANGAGATMSDEDRLRAIDRGEG